MRTLLERTVPATRWLRNYRKEDLPSDISAGLTTAVMLIPQGMAYAMLAGLPPIVGLYASMVPLALYALFGSSRELAVGPVAMVSLLVASGIAPFAESGSDQYWTMAVTLSLMVGAIQLVMGVGRLGFLVNFLSHPVISGFTSAAALIIGFSQLKHLLGVDIPRSSNIFKTLGHAFERIGETQGETLIIGLISIVILVGLKKWNPRIPRALAVVVLGTLAVVGLGLDENGVKIVGEVPAGLPSPSLPVFDMESLSGLWPTALTIALVGFMESISVAKAFASRAEYEVDANQELVALGIANLGGSLFRAYPVTGGFSRTAVNAGAGSKTPLASMITAAMVALALLFFTSLFYYLPKAVLAAIIMTAVFGLIDIHEVKHLWKVKRSDLFLLVLTFVATLAFGIEEGIIAGVLASLGWFIIQSTRPHIAVIGQLPDRLDYRNIKRHPQAQTHAGLLAIRLDAPFYFANVAFLKEQLTTLEHEMEGPLKSVVIDASGIGQLDASGADAFSQLAQSYQKKSVYLAFSGVKGPVYDVMEKGGIPEKVGKKHFFFNVHDAVQAALDNQANAGAPRA